MIKSRQTAEAPAAGPVSGGRPPFYRMIDPDAALRLVLESVARSAAQRLPLLETCGMQLDEEVRADRDYPPFDRAMMDGYAVRIADAGSTVTVVGEVAAGQSVQDGLVDGKSVEIMTGAPCPPGTQAVVRPRTHEP